MKMHVSYLELLHTNRHGEANGRISATVQRKTEMNRGGGGKEDSGRKEEK
jgi:hypothetical protein